MTIIADRATAANRQRSFVVWYKDLRRWSVNTFSVITWGWHASALRLFGNVAHRRIAPATRQCADHRSVPLGSIHFDGSISIRPTLNKNTVTRQLFLAMPGDVVYSKIDARNGAVGVVPHRAGPLAFSNEYPIYQVDPHALDPNFLHIVLRSAHFRRLLNGMASGTSGRKRIQPLDLEHAHIPVPPLDSQRRVVAAATEAHEHATKLRADADAREKAIGIKILGRLGIDPPTKCTEPSRHFVVWRANIGRWGVDSVRRSTRQSRSFNRSAFDVIPLSSLGIDTVNGYSIKPVSMQTTHRMLKLNAIQPSGLNLSASKSVDVDERIARRFDLRAGDILLCRSVGSFDLVAKSALVPADAPGYIFPDIIIRVRLGPSLVPAYARLVMESPLGREYFQGRARTAVGMWKIGAADIRDFPMPLPPLSVQHDIVLEARREQDAVDNLRSEAVTTEASARAFVEQMIFGGNSS